MRVLFDIVHPAHVHFYRHLREDLLADGHEVRVVSRQKDVTTDLLDRLDIPHRCVSRDARGGLLRSGMELVGRVARIRQEIRRFRCDLVLTRNPSGAQAARLSGVTGVFDTDDGTAAGLHFRVAKTFAHVITSPWCLPEDYGPRHRRYRGFKALAYLHPNRFTPDPLLRGELGLTRDDPLYLVRFSAYAASHDGRAQGLPLEAKRELITTLSSTGRVVVSDEAELPADFKPFQISMPSHRFHDLLAAADLCVGDSHSVTAEAAMLGTPSFRYSSFSDKLAYLRVLEDRYQLTKSFVPGQEMEFVREVRAAVAGLAALRLKTHYGRDRMLRECVDVTAWYRDLVGEFAGVGRS